MFGHNVSIWHVEKTKSSLSSESSIAWLQFSCMIWRWSFCINLLKSFFFIFIPFFFIAQKHGLENQKLTLRLKWSDEYDLQAFWRRELLFFKPKPFYNLSYSLWFVQNCCPEGSFPQLAYFLKIIDLQVWFIVKLCVACTETF